MFTPIQRVAMLSRYACLLLSASLLGCSFGGGNVNLKAVETKPIITKPEPPKPIEDEVVDVPAKDNTLPQHGFAFKNPSARYVEDKEGKLWDDKYIEKRKLILGIGKEARETLMNLRAEDSYALDEGNSLNEITLKHATYWKTAEKDKYSTRPQDKKISGLIPKGSDWSKEGDFMVYPNEDNYKALLNFDHTQLGFVSYKHTNHLAEGDLNNATLFYRGINRASSLPVTGSARYTGNWAYMLPMSYHEAQNGEGGMYAGHNLSLSRSKTSFVAEFDVNFGEKKLNGQLKTKDKDNTETTYFDINAKLQGNQFSGKAVAKQDQDAKLNHDSDALFGGFYGDKGQELGGAFYTLADKNKPNGDKTLAVAFIGKRNGAVTEEVAKLTDGKLLSWDNAESSMTLEDLGYIDDYKKVHITDAGKSVVIDLGKKEVQEIEGLLYSADSCCDNFQFLRFGNITRTSKDSNDGGGKPYKTYLFAQGELTPIAQMPTTGQAKYVGKWQMRTTVQSILDGSKDIPYDIKGDAAYLVDFGNKKLAGSLVASGGVTNQGVADPRYDPYAKIDADIKGNQFSGTANMAKAKLLDGAYRPIHVKYDKVSGAFFGPGAAELGGHITATDGKTGVVFGGKKQAENPK